MKVKDLDLMMYEFRIDDLEFRVGEATHEFIEFIIKDNGGLIVGKMKVYYENNGLDFVDDMAYPETIEMLHKTGESQKIVANIRKVINSIGV